MARFGLAFHFSVYFYTFPVIVPIIDWLVAQFDFKAESLYFS